MHGKLPTGHIVWAQQMETGGAYMVINAPPVSILGTHMMVSCATIGTQTVWARSSLSFSIGFLKRGLLTVDIFTI